VIEEATMTLLKRNSFEQVLCFGALPLKSWVFAFTAGETFKRTTNCSVCADWI
jgi:hypothetical protein